MQGFLVYLRTLLTAQEGPCCMELASCNDNNETFKFYTEKCENFIPAGIVCAVYQTSFDC